MVQIFLTQKILRAVGSKPCSARRSKLVLAAAENPRQTVNTRYGRLLCGVCGAPWLGGLWPLWSQRRMLKVCHSLEICAGRHPLCHMPAVSALRFRHTIHGFLHQSALCTRVSGAQGKQNTNTLHNVCPIQKAMMIPTLICRSCLFLTYHCPWRKQVRLSNLVEFVVQPDDRQSRYRLLKAADAFFDDKEHFEEMR